jgi:hypothetical protein
MEVTGLKFLTLAGKVDYRAGQDSGMSALRWVTAPPMELAEAVTNSSRPDVPPFLGTFRKSDASRRTVDFLSEPPLDLQRGCHGNLTQRIIAVISLSSPVLSGFPL